MGLDHYFSGQHELAISVWTRVLFLDRSHARARAYIERARGAIAERHREGEELLHAGEAAFSRGDAADARQLLVSAAERGARPDEAMALLERLDRLAPGEPVRPERARLRRGTVERERTPGRLGASPATLLLVLAIGLAAGALVMMAWSSGVFPWLQPEPTPTVVSPQVREPLPVPGSSDVAIARANAWVKSGRLRDALTALDTVRRGDPRRAEADDLRAAIQQTLLDAAHASRPQSAPPR